MAGRADELVADDGNFRRNLLPLIIAASTEDQSLKRVSVRYTT
jgi:hypothetical protein